MKKLLTLLLVLITCSVSAIDMGPYDPGAARKSDLDLKLDLDGGNAPTTIPLVNASFTGDIDVTGDVLASSITSGTTLKSFHGTGVLGVASATLLTAKLSNAAHAAAVKVTGFAVRRGATPGTPKIFERWFLLNRVAGADVVLVAETAIGFISDGTSGGGAVNANPVFSWRRSGSEAADATQGIILDVSDAEAVYIYTRIDIMCDWAMLFSHP